MRLIRWTTEASDQLESAVRRIQHDNPTAARNVAQAVIDRIEQPGNLPRPWPTRRSEWNPRTRHPALHSCVPFHRRNCRNPAHLAKIRWIEVDWQQWISLGKMPALVLIDHQRHFSSQVTFPQSICLIAAADRPGRRAVQPPLPGSRTLRRPGRLIILLSLVMIISSVLLEPRVGITVSAQVKKSAPDDSEVRQK